MTIAVNRKTRPPRVAVVIPAGGSGTRLGGRLPKQFLKIGGEPILLTTARQLAGHPSVALVVVAAPGAYLARTRRVLRPLAGRVTLKVVEGGAERQDSVWRALLAVPEDMDIVLVHDAVRPFVTCGLIDEVLRATVEAGAALCARPIAETVKRVSAGMVVETLDRRGLWAVQTPQGFRAALLREAHDKARREGVVATDDAMLVERLGQPVRVVAGLAANVKITTPEDLRRARATTRDESDRRTAPRVPRADHPGRQPGTQAPIRTAPRAPRADHPGRQPGTQAPIRTAPRAPRAGHPRRQPGTQAPIGTAPRAPRAGHPRRKPGTQAPIE
jgi:2-C-methyl-D-erythritol 4-phosphate cytidylyltransferase